MAPIAITPEATETPVAVSAEIKRIQTEDAETIDLVLRQFRCLIADLCQQFNGGHPGYASLANIDNHHENRQLTN